MHTAVFDIGKTNKKFLIFDEKYNVVHEEERTFEEIPDKDGFLSDDLDEIEKWIKKTVESHKFQIEKLNFSTYGASLVHIDQQGNRVGDFVNYLKPIDESVLDDILAKNGGSENFSVQTASPIMGLLNSGFQLPYLKTQQPNAFSKIHSSLHFPQYLSYLFTNKITSDISSIGCHTAMWNFKNNRYHDWLKDFDVDLPEPLPNNTTFTCEIAGTKIDIGIGMHDSSASLVPYIQNSSEPFILISTGTWCINMNPFNNDLLTAEELKQDCLCYISHLQKQVKSSRLFLGHYHDKLNAQLCEHYHVDPKAYKTIKLNPEFLNGPQRILEVNGEPKLRSSDSRLPSSPFGSPSSDFRLPSYSHAYHQLMKELTELEIEKIKLVIPKVDNVKKLIVTGGFIYNEIFIHLLQEAFPDKTVEVSELKNASALGAAMVLKKQTQIRDASHI